MNQKAFSKVTMFTLASSLAFTALTSVALILLATMLSQQYPDIHSLVIGAATMQSVGAVLLVRVAWAQCNVKRLLQGSEVPGKPPRKYDAVIACVALLIGHIATLASIIWIMANEADIEAATAGSPSLVVYTLAGFWTMAIVSEVAFAWGFHSDRATLRSLRQGRRFHSPSPYWPVERQRSRSESPESIDDPNALLSAPSAFDSRQHAPRPFPETRFTNLARQPQRCGSLEPLNGPPSSSRDISVGGTHSSRESSDSAFDSWDTSAVSDELRQVMAAEPSRSSMSRNPSGARLPTIPGSRPVSVANLIEGAFLLLDGEDAIEQELTLAPPPPAMLEAVSSEDDDDDDDDNPFFKPLPIPPSKPALAAPTPTLRLSRPQITHYHTYDASSSPLNSRNALRRGLSATHRPSLLRAVSLASMDSLSPARSSATTPVNESHDEPLTGRDHTHGHSHKHAHIHGDAEAHIHPLFRTTSPSPPPLTSANTVVTAAPISLVDIPLSVARASVDRIRDARGISVASSTRSAAAAAAAIAASPPVSPRLPRSPASPTFPNYSNPASPRFPQAPIASQSDHNHSQNQSRSQSRSSSRPGSRVDGSVVTGAGQQGFNGSAGHSRTQSRTHSRNDSRMQSRPPSRPESRQQSRPSSRPQSRGPSRAGSRTGIVFQGPAGNVPPTPMSPVYPMSPASSAFPTSHASAASPVVAVSPNGKVITKDDLARTGNHIVCD